MHGDDEVSQRSEPNVDSATDATPDDDQELTLTFSYDPQATLEGLFGISEETLFQVFDLALTRAGVRESVEVSVLITSDEGIRTLNREYRGKDEPTDVLSFPLLDHPLVNAPADQLWQAPELELGEDAAVDGETGERDSSAGEMDLEEAEDFSDEFSDDGEVGEQSLKGMIVLMDDESADEEMFADEPENWPTHLGDVVIARETAQRQAQQAGHRVAYEVAFLFAHGVLHLVGFDDHTDAGYQAMVAHQEAALADAGVTR